MIMMVNVDLSIMTVTPLYDRTTYCTSGRIMNIFAVIDSRRRV